MFVNCMDLIGPPLPSQIRIISLTVLENRMYGKSYVCPCISKTFKCVIIDWSFYKGYYYYTQSIVKDNNNIIWRQGKEHQDTLDPI